MTLGRRLVWILILVVCAGVVLTWYLLKGREGEQESKAPSRVSTQAGERVITLDQATQTRSGVATVPLQAMAYRQQLQAYGTVLDIQGLAEVRKTLLDLRKNLADLRTNEGAARAQSEKAKASLEASQKQYERLKILHDDNRNVSDKALEAGVAALRSDEASMRASQQGVRASQEARRAAEESIKVLRNTASEQWGNTIARWVFDDSPAFLRIVQRQDVLLQITLPSGTAIASPPDSVLVQTAAGKTTPAKLISSSPRTDPRIQGMSFFYVAPSQPDMIPGMNIRAYLPVGQNMDGVFVPASAVVWWQGKTWTYIQRASNQFVRREIAADLPVQEGWFVSGVLSANDRIVVKGAELLLSEEFRPQIEAEE
jgi:hypothetical protein